MTWVEPHIAETQAQAAAFRLPALFCALLNAGCDPELAYAANEEVKSWAKADQEAGARLGPRKPPALFRALLNTGCDPELAYHATEEVKSWTGADGVARTH